MPRKITTYHANLRNSNTEERKTVRVEDCADAYDAYLRGDKVCKTLGPLWWTATVQRYTMKELKAL
jgi:hypothetical protein|tara:strand:- start:5 stop:202 length:198 start_codon:yes stop_codon:yes gene_type:complete